MNDIVRKYTIRASEKGDPLEYVMSDDSVDRYGDIIDVKGWDLTDFKKNPIALFGHNSNFPIGHWRNVRVEKGKLLGRLELVARGISERIDEIIALVEAGVLRAVSVGFRPLKAEAIDEKEPWAGLRFTKSELLECSLVSIPANPNALAVAKTMHVSEGTQGLVFGEFAGDQAGIMALRNIPGKTADPKVTQPPKDRPKMTLAERIKEAEARLNALRDQLVAEVAKSAETSDDPAAAVAINELSDRIEAAQQTHDSLKKAEERLASGSALVRAPAATAGGGMETSGRVFATAGRKSTGVDLIVRRMAVHAMASILNKSEEDILNKMYPDDSNVAMITKAAVAGATTTAAGWAAELVNTAMGEFLETLRPRSVYPGLAAAGGGRLAFGPNAGAIKIPSRAATPSIGGSFIGEGAPIPVRRLGLTSVTLSPKKMGVLSVFSREIARYGTPAIETLLRNEILADTAITLDSLLLDATAGSTVRPAGLTNGVTPLTATAGGGQAAILGDIKKLRAPFDTANAGANLILLMNPAQELSLALTPNSGGELGWADPVVNRFGVLTSTAIAAGTVIMIDAEDFVTATGDVPEFEISNEATLHMEDTTPLQIGTTGTPTVVAAPVQSMFQTAQIAIRMLLDVSWAMRRTGMVQTIVGVTW